MDYISLINNITGKTSKVGIIGAIRGYGYTLFVQIPKTKHMDLGVIYSRHPEEYLEVSKRIGYDEDQIIFCERKSEVEQAPKEAILIVSDYRLVMEYGITALVECMGNTTVSSDAVLAVPRAGVNVYMVPEETNSMCGPLLSQVAAEHGVVHVLVNGDQPCNLPDLYSWVVSLSLKVVAAGKSNEYGFVWDGKIGESTCTDGNDVMEEIPRMQDCQYYNGVEMLDQCHNILERYTRIILADFYETNPVSDITGLMSSSSFLSYPVTKTDGLVNIFVPEEDGGILRKTGVVSVLYNLRGKDEVSFCGGEFIIIKCGDEKAWEILENKGYVMSKDDRYAYIYYPYYYMGLETPISILLGNLMGIGTHPECRQVSVLAGVTEQDLLKDTQLMVQGCHYAIDGLIPELLEKTSGQDFAPFYLLNGAILLRDVKKGDPITLEDVDLAGLETYKLYTQGLDIRQNRGDRAHITK